MAKTLIRPVGLVTTGRITRLVLWIGGFPLPAAPNVAADAAHTIG
jgi:hypothetical protein